MTTAATIRQQIDELLDTLFIDDQRAVLRFIQSLHGLPPSITGKELMQLLSQMPPEAIDAAAEVAEFLASEREKELGVSNDSPSADNNGH